MKLLLLPCFFFTLFGFGQSRAVIDLNSQLKFSPDSIEQQHILNSLTGLLAANKKPANDNQYIWPEELPATAALLAQIRGLDTMRIVLDNLVNLGDGHYEVQFSFLTNVKKDLAAAIDLIAVKGADGYKFYSPLHKNTFTWPHKTIGRFKFYYLSALNMTLVTPYVKKAMEFDHKLHSPYYQTSIYFCDDAPRAMAALGISYMASQSGEVHNGFSAFGNQQSLLVFGYPSSDPEVLDIHDCWHNRLRNAPKRGEVNRFMDEACAYAYGGSWGMSWPEILAKFKAVMAGKTDWLTVYRENKQFGPSTSKHLYAAYVIDALLIEKIEKDKGFTAVIPVLYSGKKEPDDAAFFAALENADGINISNFNATIAALLVK